MKLPRISLWLVLAAALLACCPTRAQLVFEEIGRAHV